MVVFQSGLLFFFFFFFFHRSTDTSARWGPSCLLIRDRVVSVVAPCETADCIFRAILFLIVVYVCVNTVAAVRSVMNATGFRLIVCNDNDDKVLSMWHYVFARPGRLLICHQPSLCKVSLIFKTFSYSKWIFFVCVCEMRIITINLHIVFPPSKSIRRGKGETILVSDRRKHLLYYMSSFLGRLGELVLLFVIK